MFHDVRRGDIWYADNTMVPKDPTSRAIYGNRPVLVLSANRINAREDVVMVAPLTSKLQHSDDCYRVHITPTPDNGLTAESLVLADQITTLDRNALDAWVGILDAQDMTTVEEAARAALKL